MEKDTIDRYTSSWYKKGGELRIASYGNKETEKFDLNGFVSKNCSWRGFKGIVRRKLDILACANSVQDLMAPPGNRFEWLKGDLKGYASIRINNQWRIIFMVNKNRELEAVQIADYH